MADYLIVKYNDGYISTPGKTSSAGYPKEWLDAVGYGKTKIINKKNLFRVIYILHRHPQ
jgi:hypothetical protein